MADDEDGCIRFCSVDQLLRIASAGGGLRLKAAAIGLSDLMRIASAASSHGARITVVGSAAIGADGMMRIASAGKGCVAFEG